MDQPGSMENRQQAEEEGACGGDPVFASFALDLNQYLPGYCDDSAGPPALTASSGDGGSDTLVITHQEDFLTKILPKFLDYVDPIESGLVDTLRGVEALSSEDEQSIREENTRRKKARKLLDKLHDIPEEDFAHSFVPKLKKTHPHVLSGLVFRPQDNADTKICMRHAMRKRINLKRLIDLLRAAKCCSMDEYRRLMANQYCGNKEWEEVFELLHVNASNPDLRSAVENMLKKKKIGAPERYHESAVTGFVCMCHSSSYQPCSPDSGNADDNTEPKSSWTLRRHHEEESSGTYPSSALSSKSLASEPIYSDSGYSELSMDAVMLQPALFSDIQQFQTMAQKVQYKKVENQINSAITATGEIRADFRRLENVRDDARSLAKQAKDEAPSEATNQKLKSLLQRARELLSAIQSSFRNVQESWEQVSNLESCFTFALPDDWGMLLRKRHYLLQKEIQECQPFVEKADSIFEEITPFCQPLPLV
ncbi:uncharacterized protein LOC143292857 [Babylonia areolata]|uniref:uncharacterized protein LOC143292857 n=1 Tax=Babylonia areolata TaxID=304850 RepID=UPI003FD6972E